MSEVERKLHVQSQLVTVDFGKVGFALLRADRLSLVAELQASYPDDTPAQIESRLPARPASLLCTIAIRTHFKDGMPKADATCWAAWREGFIEDDPTVTLPWRAIDWLRKILNDEKLMLPPDLAQWWEALTSYLDTLQPAPARPET